MEEEPGRGSECLHRIVALENSGVEGQAKVPVAS